MKFGQLIEYSMRNILLEKSYTKYGEETSPRPSSRKSTLKKNSIQFDFFIYPRRGLPKYIGTKNLTTCFYLT